MRPALFFFFVFFLCSSLFSLCLHITAIEWVNECGTATLSSGEAAMSKIRAQWHLFGLMNDWEPSNLWHFPSIYKIFTTNCCCCRCSLDCIAWALFFFLLMCFVLFTCISTALFYLAVVASLQTFYFVLVKQSAKSNENDSFASHINYYHFFFIWL